jgi:hypothetical protein
LVIISIFFNGFEELEEKAFGTIFKNPDHTVRF